MSRLEDNHRHAAREGAPTGADWFGIGAMGALLVCSLILFARVMATGMLSNSTLGLIMVALLVLAAVSVFVLLPVRRSKLGKVLGGAVALLLCVAMLWGVGAAGSLQSALSRISGRTVKSDIIAVIVTADDPAQELADTEGYTFGYAAELDRENTDTLMEHIKAELQDVKDASFDDIFRLADALYDDEVDAIILNKGYLTLLESNEDYADFSRQTKIIYEHEITREIVIDTNREDVTRKPFVVFCNGIDARNSNLSVNSNSDVNILAVINPRTHQILLINTPRDYYVPLHMNGKMDKLTHAGVYGIEESMGTLADLYNVEIPYYVRLNFFGLVDIVDALGGVDVNSPMAFTTNTMEIPNEYGYLVDGIAYSFPEGPVHLTGREALAFSRERYAFRDGDMQRGRNQMEVIRGIVNKAISPAILSRYQDVLNAVADAFITNLTYEEIAALVQMQQKDMQGWNVTTYAVGMGDGNTMQPTYSAGVAWVMPPDYETVNTARDLIQQVLNGETPQVPAQ
ncbi:MAG: LCP family protein [Oscillospiraceae bacterium]|nr:LCP family protein [Oscillospiraceae bacterium]